MSYHHQDWETVYLKKQQKQSENVSRVTHVQKTPSHIRKLEENDVNAPKMYEKDFISKVVNKRIQLKMTQNDLAKILNVNAHIIANFERGNGIYNGQFVTRMNQKFLKNKKYEKPSN